MPAAAIVPCLLSLAFFGTFAAVLGWGAWYSRDRRAERTAG